MSVVHQEVEIRTRSLPEMLTVEGSGDVFWSAYPSRDKKWFFGGEVAAQALLASALTVDEARRPHAATFQYLRAGDATRRTEYRVERTRDGGTFSARTAQAWQDGELLLTASVSFQADEQGSFEHGPPAAELPHVALPAPEAAYVGDERFEEWRATVTGDRDVHLVFDGPPARAAGLRHEVGEARQRVWYRSRSPLQDDPRIHTAALAYLSDSLFLSVALGPHGVAFGEPGLQYATLNHSLWFHRPARADEWVLYDQNSPWASGGRALCQGRMYDAGGALVATVVQEGLVRMRETTAS